MNRFKYSILYILIFYLLITCSTPTNKLGKEDTIETIETSILELKQLIEKDSIHKKALIIFNPYCMSCVDHFKEDYSEFMEKPDTSVRFFFIIDNCKDHCENIPTISSFVKKYSLPIYCILDTSPRFSILDTNRMENIVKFIFPQENNLKVINGVPISLLASPSGKIYKIQYQDKPNEWYPCPIHEIVNQDISKINFDKILISENNY